MFEINKIYQGDALSVLKTFPDEYIDCVITSSPYWGLRNYGCDKQIGLEKTFQEFINKLCNVFSEVKRVLKKEGTVWINLGDTYGTQSGSMGNDTSIQPKYKSADKVMNFKQPNINMHKCSLMIPERVAIELINRGFILRNKIIWEKPDAMPSSTKDRFSVNWEYIYFFVKNKKYYFKQQLEPVKKSSIKRTKYKWNGHKEKGSSYESMDIKKMCHIEGRNKRCVWKINTASFPGNHFSTFPEKLIEIPIKSGCPENGIVLDPFMGAGTTGLVAQKLNRNYIGIELNPEYIKIAEKRIDIGKKTKKKLLF